MRLEETIRDALKRSDVVISTGGLGPTEDDITRGDFGESRRSGTRLSYGTRNGFARAFQEMGTRNAGNQQTAGFHRRRRGNFAESERFGGRNVASKSTANFSSFCPDRRVKISRCLKISFFRNCVKNPAKFSSNAKFCASRESANRRLTKRLRRFINVLQNG